MKLVLASRSPRRQMLLRQAGYEPSIAPSPIDEGLLPQGHVGPADWVISLAYIKAWSTMDQISGQGDVIVLGADTLCLIDGSCLGQPKTRDEAYRMIDLLQGRSHETLTGVCLLRVEQCERCLFVDRTRVNLGRLNGHAISQYIESDDWQGKAGGYNLADRLEAGWPIKIDGDPTTVMGLPMQALSPLLERIGITS
jgi:septum formation protein